jgi:hypothetical protein
LTPVPVGFNQAMKSPMEQDPRPYWRRAHLDWRLWIVVFVLFAAIAMYILKVDLTQIRGI